MNSLRATPSTLFTQPSVDLVLARLEYMLAFFKSKENVAQERIDLDIYIDDQPKCTSVHNCGAPACVGGHVALEFAPLSFKVTKHGLLEDRKGNVYAPNTLACHFLDTTHFEFGNIFNARMNSNVTPRQEAIARIKAAIKVVKKAIKEG